MSNIDKDVIYNGVKYIVSIKDDITSYIDFNSEKSVPVSYKTIIFKLPYVSYYFGVSITKENYDNFCSDEDSRNRYINRLFTQAVRYRVNINLFLEEDLKYLEIEN